MKNTRPFVYGIKAIIFDMDLTLLDSYHSVVKVHQYIGKTFYNIDIPESKIRKHWGLPAEQLWALIYDNADTSENIARRIQKARDGGDFEIPAFNHTLDIINLLKKTYILGILTACSTKLAIYLLEKVGFKPEEFFTIQGSEMTEFHKPNPKVFNPVFKTLEDKGIKKEEILYVGDSLSDFQASTAAGINFIAVTTGFDNSDKFVTAGLDKSYIIQKLSELCLILNV